MVFVHASSSLIWCVLLFWRFMVFYKKKIVLTSRYSLLLGTPSVRAFTVPRCIKTFLLYVYTYQRWRRKPWTTLKYSIIAWIVRHSFSFFVFFFYFSIASNKMDLANRWDQLNSIQLSTTQSAISATYTHIRISWRIDGFLDAFYIPVKLCTCQDFLLLAGYSAWCANTFTVGGRRWIQLEDDTNCERNGMKHTHTETIKLIIPSVH